MSTVPTHQTPRGREPSAADLLAAEIEGMRLVAAEDLAAGGTGTTARLVQYTRAAAIVEWHLDSAAPGMVKLAAIRRVVVALDAAKDAAWGGRDDPETGVPLPPGIEGYAPRAGS